MTLLNSSRTLSDALRAISVIKGTKKKMKLVFVDAESTDGSLEMLRDFKNRNEDAFQLIDIVSQKCDITEGRNICIDRSQGLFVLFVDSDVVISPDLVNDIEAILLSDLRLAFINVPCVVEEKQKGWLDRFYELIGEPLGMSCAAIRISALHDVGPYFIGFPGGGENPNELMLRLKSGLQGNNFQQDFLTH